MFGFGRMNMAIIGTGYMAGVMAETIRYVPQVRPYAIASRDLERALEFGRNHNFKMAYGSYEELVEDKDVELVYIATPVTEHYDHIRMCIEHGIPVICEKPFALSAKEAEELFALAKERNVFVADGLRLRFLPFGGQIRDVLQSGVIGTPVMLAADLAFPIGTTSRVVNPMLGGGALMEVGVYLLAAAAMFFGDDIRRISSTCVYTKEGLDRQDSVTIEYTDGRMAVLSFTISGAGENRCVITGTTGFMVIDNITGLSSLKVYDAARNETASHRRPRQKTGYEYVLKACVEAIKEGKTECEQAPHGQTLSILHMTDHIRKQLGVVYPKEKPPVPAVQEEPIIQEEPVLPEETPADVRQETPEPPAEQKPMSDFFFEAGELSEEELPAEETVPDQEKSSEGETVSEQEKIPGEETVPAKEAIPEEETKPAEETVPEPEAAVNMEEKKPEEEGSSPAAAEKEDDEFLLDSPLEALTSINTGAIKEKFGGLLNSVKDRLKN